MALRKVSVVGGSILVCAAAGSIARAAEPEKVEKVVVRNRQNTLGLRFDLGATFGLTVINRMTDHMNLNLDLAMNFSEEWALVLGGGYALGKHTSVAHDAFIEVGKKDPVSTTAGSGSLPEAHDFHDLWVLAAHAELNLRWQPVYGKINLLSELPIHFQWYLTVGAGAGQFRRDSVVFCLKRGYAPAGAEHSGKGTRQRLPWEGPPIPDPEDDRNLRPYYADSDPANLDSPDNTGKTADGCREPLREREVKVVGNLGIGLRFFLTRHLAVKLELRNYFFPDRYYVFIKREVVARGDATNAAAQGTEALDDWCRSPDPGNPEKWNCSQAANPGFTQLVLFNAGVQWIF